MNGPGLSGRSLDEAMCFERQNHLMYGGRRDSKVLLQIGLRGRTSMDFAVVINESQILTLSVKAFFMVSDRINQNSNRLSTGVCRGRFPLPWE